MNLPQITQIVADFQIDFSVRGERDGGSRRGSGNLNLSICLNLRKSA